MSERTYCESCYSYRFKPANQPCGYCRRSQVTMEVASDASNTRVVGDASAIDVVSEVGTKCCCCLEHRRCGICPQHADVTEAMGGAA